jgi:hypothetical protein
MPDHMRKLSLILLLSLAGSACNDDDGPEKFTSINGYWIVRTPDDATEVAFQVAQDGDARFIIQGVSVNHRGSDYNSKPIDAAINVTSATEIESITMVNTTAQIPFFVIRLQQIVVNSSFTEMQINISSFNIDGVFRQFPMIKATRD